MTWRGLIRLTDEWGCTLAIAVVEVEGSGRGKFRVLRLCRTLLALIQGSGLGISCAILRLENESLFSGVLGYGTLACM